MSSNQERTSDTDESDLENDRPCQDIRKGQELGRKVLIQATGVKTRQPSHSIMRSKQEEREDKPSSISTAVTLY